MHETELLDCACAALTHWDIDIADVAVVSQSENIVFRIAAVTATATDQAFVLRLHRPGYHNLAELEAEQTWTAALRDCGMGAPVSVRTRSGAGYAQVRVGTDLRYAGVLKWVEGTPLAQHIEKSTDSDCVAAMFTKIGELMGTMHKQASNWQIPAGFSRQRLDAAGFVGEQPFWGRFWEAQTLTAAQRSYLGELRHKVAALLAAIPTHSNSFGLIHADLHPGNIIVNHDQMHVIDFDDAGFGWHIYDIAVALKNYEDQQHFDKARAALIAGYRRKRALNDATLQMLPLFLLVRALATIGWVAARPELGHSDYTAKLLNYVYANADSALSALEN